ncbi:FAD-binding oxidoreductase [Arsenicicoccus piscis]|uniref:FAD-dependent oxidoreductase n=1 Tax=Arsenicicoccus piscis TaxID=673954 RepID=A0ABQ6HSK1_9MICO|nr:FAD-binding oxidoreductase [Arsenicicoccus piscis]GMA20663.1 FAD-dependent oxidoreductase [Arsenicicoccus piscis]
MSSTAVVIGAGIIGSDVAYELAKAGYDVTVVDKGPGPGSGSTSASSACIRFNYSTITSVAVSWEAKLLWADWESYLEGTDDGQLASFIQVGGLSVDLPGSTREPVSVRFDKVGVPHEVLTKAELEERFPAMDFTSYYPPKPVTEDAFWDDSDQPLTCTYMPDAGFMDDPQFAAHNLMAAARRKGATFRFRAGVAEILRTGEGDEQRVSGVRLEDGTVIEADVVVNAAGPHSGQINELAGVLDDFAVTTRPMRVEVHHFRAPEGYGRADGTPGPFMADTDLGTYFRGEPGGGILNGGAEPACDELEWLDNPDVYTPTATQAVYEAQSYRLARRIPELQIPNTPSGVVGIYDVSSDWVPIYDKTSLPGFYVAIGTSGNQFKNAPVVGQILRAVIDHCEAGHDHDTEPAPLTLPRTGVELDLSEYSRLREVDPDAGGAGIFA